MKAISLHQPWASLIMCGAKRVETRSWRPPESLIGERIAIHAAKRIDDCVLDDPFSRYIADPVRDAPQGVLLGSVLLEGVWLIEHRAEAKMVAHEYHRLNEDGTPEFDYEAVAHELAFGDFTVGRWAWGLADVRRLNEPMPLRGRQRIFDISTAVETAMSERSTR